jgi:hypothetical protein
MSLLQPSRIFGPTCPKMSTDMHHKGMTSTRIDVSPGKQEGWCLPSSSDFLELWNPQSPTRGGTGDQRPGPGRGGPDDPRAQSSGLRGRTAERLAVRDVEPSSRRDRGRGDHGEPGAEERQARCVRPGGEAARGDPRQARSRHAARRPLGSMRRRDRALRGRAQGPSPRARRGSGVDHETGDRGSPGWRESPRGLRLWQGGGAALHSGNTKNPLISAVEAVLVVMIVAAFVGAFGGVYTENRRRVLRRISRTAFSTDFLFSMVSSPFGAWNPLLDHRPLWSKLGRRLRPAGRKGRGRRMSYHGRAERTWMTFI